MLTARVDRPVLTDPTSRPAGRPRLATIPPDRPFLDSLAGWWLARGGADPLTLANGLFLLPTRRAARALQEAFLRQAEGRPLLLPRIAALGAVDEAPLALTGALDLAPAIAEADRLAILTRLILALNGRDGAPRDAAAAWQLAGELALLLDEAARAEIDLAAKLPCAVGEDFAAHWNVTLDFLQIVTRFWPEHLAEHGLSDVAHRQRALLDTQTAAWEANPPAMPVIAAGSTGAIPAIGRLLHRIARLGQGLVVLPGLDQALDEDTWQALEHTHPQASLRALLSLMDARREDALPWDRISLVPSSATRAAPSARLALLRHALLPARSLGLWQNFRPDPDPGLQRLEPADQQEEARAIALVLRQSLETPGARAALVTPDRFLARRVAAELLRFGIVADDSAGEPLAETPPAIFLRLLAEAVTEELRPVPLLALLKHPLCAAGLAPAHCRDEARTLERDALRGPRPASGLAGLRGASNSDAFLDRLETALSPLLHLGAGAPLKPADLLAALLQAAESLATTDEIPGARLLWSGEDGDALAAHLAALLTALDALPPQPPDTLPRLLESLLAGPSVRSRRALRGRTDQDSEHPRIFIWGLLEARLQTADLIVLGGLTEGTWPPLGESGPWMNRPMRKAVGLPSPEEQLGLAAHDFVMACCAAPDIVLSAPRRRDRAPAVPSRWLARLDALLAGETRRAGQTMALPHHPAAAWAQTIDRPDGAPRPVPPPAPRPAVILRPRRLSVTAIETFMRDPYAIYARFILKLKRLDPLEQSADAADYGAIVHDGLHRFFARNKLAWPASAEAQLAQDMEHALGTRRMRPALAAWWRPRLRRIAAFVAEAERDRRANGPPRILLVESTGQWSFAAPAGDFCLHGRADRIEQRPDGAWAIIDYKTGTPPTAAQIASGLSPQLPLEAAMLRHGAFGATHHGETAELTYWHISGGFEPGRVMTLFNADAAQTIAIARQAEDQVQHLIAIFDDENQPYLSQPSPAAAPRFSDYAVLSRAAEWAALDES